jgi:hypothetical protein
MIGLLAVQIHEMTTVVRQQNSLLTHGKCQHIIVRKSLARPTALISRQNIMS